MIRYLFDLYDLLSFVNPYEKTWFFLPDQDLNFMHIAIIDRWALSPFEDILIGFKIESRS
jgi:hypothetical protein